METNLQNLRKTLTDLKNQYGFVSIKSGTETEDMGETEIALLASICHGILPLGVKIGGPEARNDLRICQRIGIHAISAPMIESEYALRNFIQTMKNLYTPSDYLRIKKSINLETITGYRNLFDIFDSADFEEIDQITAARSDLSASMNKTPDDKEVTRVAKNIVKEAKERKKLTSVGGTITKSNLSMIIGEIEPDFVNSRHVMIEVKKAAEVGPAEVAECMLIFEMELYEFYAKLFPEKGFYYRNRVEINRERIGERKVLYFMR